MTHFRHAIFYVLQWVKITEAAESSQVAPSASPVLFNLSLRTLRYRVQIPGTWHLRDDG